MRAVDAAPFSRVWETEGGGDLAGNGVLVAGNIAIGHSTEGGDLAVGDGETGYQQVGGIDESVVVNIDKVFEPDGGTAANVGYDKGEVSGVCVAGGRGRNSEASSQEITAGTALQKR